MPARRLPTEFPRLHGGAVPILFSVQRYPRASVNMRLPFTRVRTNARLPFARANGMPLSPFAFAAARA